MEGSFGAYLAGLLGGVSAYRVKWDLPDFVQRTSTGPVSQAAIARTVSNHVSDVGGPVRSESGWKTLVWKALGDHACSEDFLDLLIEVFAIDENPVHEYRLRMLHAATFSQRTGTGPIPSSDWIPEEVLSKAGSVRRHRTLSVHETHVVGPDGQAVEHRSAQVIEAVSEGCDRYFFNFDARSVEIDVLSGGKVVGAFETDGGLRCIEVAFGRHVHVGDTHRFEIVARFLEPTTLPPRVRRASADRIRRVSIRVEFDPGRLPVLVEWGEWDTIADDLPTRCEPVALDRDHSVHRFVEQADRPVVGFSWQFGD